MARTFDQYGDEPPPCPSAMASYQLESGAMACPSSRDEEGPGEVRSRLCGPGRSVERAAAVDGERCAGKLVHLG